MITQEDFDELEALRAKVSPKEEETAVPVGPTKEAAQEEAAQGATVSVPEMAGEPGAITPTYDIEQTLAELASPPTTMDKLKYGFAKATTLAGNAYDFWLAEIKAMQEEEDEPPVKGLAYFQNDTWKKKLEERRQRRGEILEEFRVDKQEVLNQRFPKFANGDYDNDMDVMIGSLGKVAVDPIAWMFPWSKAYQAAGKVGSLSVNTSFAAGDVALREYVETGEGPSPEALQFAILFGAGLTALDPLVSKVAGKMSSIYRREGRITEAAFLNNFDNLTAAEREQFEKIIQSDPIKRIQDKKASFADPKKAIDDYNKAIATIEKQAKKSPRLSGEVKARRKIAANRVLGKRIEDAHLLDLEHLTEIAKQYSASSTWTQKTADFFVDRMVSYAIRPAIYGSIGLGSGSLLYDDPEMAIAVGLAAAGAGALHRFAKDKALAPTVKDSLIKKLDDIPKKELIQKLDLNIPHTLQTKLEGRGGPLATFSHEMFGSMNIVGDKMVKESVRERSDIMRGHLVRAATDLTKNTSVEVNEEAVRILRGYGDQNNGEAMKVAAGLKEYMNTFRQYFEEVGLNVTEELQNYFPRIFNKKAIHKNREEFKNDLRTWAKENAGWSDAEFDKRFSSVYNHIMKGSDQFDDAMKLANADNAEEFLQMKLRLPILHHLESARKLDPKNTQGFEKAMEKWLVNDPQLALNKYAESVVRSVEFARSFGVNGEGIKAVRQQIHDRYQPFKDAYKKKEGVEWSGYFDEERKELQLMYDSVNAFFGTYDKKINNNGYVKAIAGFQTLANLKYMPTVSLSAMADLFQPIQNSDNWKSIAKGLYKTKVRGTKEQYADSLSMVESRAIMEELRSTGVFGQLDDSVISNILTNTNDWVFKLALLPNVTSLARRFAFNTGMEDAHQLAIRALNPSTSSKEKMSLFRKLGHLGLNKKDAQEIAQFNNVESAFADDGARTILERAGFKAAERDVHIHNVGNRMLFTQSRNPFIRALGQYASWAQWKAAQTNKLIDRMEDGDMKLIAKWVGTLPLIMANYEFRYGLLHGEPSPAWEEGNLGEVLGQSMMHRGDPGYFIGTLINALEFDAETPFEIFPVGAQANAFMTSLGDAADGEWGKAFGDIFNDAILYRAYKSYNPSSDPMQKVEDKMKEVYGGEWKELQQEMNEARTP